MSWTKNSVKEGNTSKSSQYNGTNRGRKGQRTKKTLRGRFKAAPTLTQNSGEVIGLGHKKSKEEMEREVLQYQQELINKGDIADPDTIDFENFIEYCEYQYGMNSDEFLMWYENTAEGEGNSDMKMWEIIAKKKRDEQKRKG